MMIIIIIIIIMEFRENPPKTWTTSAFLVVSNSHPQSHTRKGDVAAAQHLSSQVLVSVYPLYTHPIPRLLHRKAWDLKNALRAEALCILYHGIKNFFKPRTVRQDCRGTRTLQTDYELSVLVK